jgi:hypothetical protein
VQEKREERFLLQVVFIPFLTWRWGEKPHHSLSPKALGWDRMGRGIWIDSHTLMLIFRYLGKSVHVGGNFYFF